MKIFITGITGFVGRYLVEYLEKIPNIKIGGTSFNGKTEGLEKLAEIFKCDLRDKKSIDKVIKKFKPDAVIHLAGISSAGNSWKDAEITLTNNIIGQLHLLNSLKDFAPKAKTLIISSGQVYGAVKKSELPTKESVSLNPTNPYAVSKITQELLGLQYFSSYNMPIVILRPSNHIGPRQEGHLVIPSFIKQIVEIEKGKRKPVMKVGSLDAKRDFTDVRDIVKSYFLALKKGKPGEIYNIGSSKAISIRKILEKIIKLSDRKIKIETDKNLLRPSDIPVLEVDCKKFKKDTGWKPEILLEKTLEDTLNYWREKI